MIHVVDILIAVSGLVSFTWSMIVWGRGFRIVRRISAQPTGRAADVTAGPTELAGRITVVGDPLTSLDGAEVAAHQRRIVVEYEGDDSKGDTLEKVVTTTTDLEIEDESGSCILELGETILLGPTRRHRFAAEACAEEHPDVWAIAEKLVSGDNKVVFVRIEESVLPQGAVGFVSGEAGPSDRLDTSSGAYRGGARRLKVSGSETHPLIAAAWKESEVLSFLRAPLRRTLAMALLSLFVTAIAVAVPFLVAAHAHV